MLNINTITTDSSPLAGIIGVSQAMNDIISIVRKVANTDSTILISGESGTGKELIAKGIHLLSKRSAMPLVSINCGAIPEGLMESELFGHEKGAFTGAMRTRIGKFEAADKGTIFLDEVGDMSPALQVKLLRVLQEHEFERVGGISTIRINVRVISATNKDLGKNIAENRFRDDLYYRLNVIPIHVPPLRDRKDDIPVLTMYFLRHFNKVLSKDITGISKGALDIMTNYPWPGNVRELENMVERIVIFKDHGEINTDDLPFPDSGKRDNHWLASYNDRDLLRDELKKEDKGNGVDMGVNGSIMLQNGAISLNRMLEDYERGLILDALKRSNWVKNKAAILLSINRTTLIEKIKRLKITEDKNL